MTSLPPPDTPTWLQAFVYAAFAAFAGLLGYILRSMDAGLKVTYPRAFVEALSAGVVGLIAMWICQASGLSMQWTGVTVAVSGWLGANASIQVLQRLVWRKLGISPKDVDNEPAP